VRLGRPALFDQAAKGASRIARDDRKHPAENLVSHLQFIEVRRRMAIREDLPDNNSILRDIETLVLGRAIQHLGRHPVQPAGSD
jgi:hypothetical protein